MTSHRIERDSVTEIRRIEREETEETEVEERSFVIEIRTREIGSVTRNSQAREKTDVTDRQAVHRHHQTDTNITTAENRSTYVDTV